MVLGRTAEWLLSPDAPYERVGDVPNVVFPCGIIERPGGELRVYYGAADTSVCMATTTVDAVLATLEIL